MSWLRAVAVAAGLVGGGVVGEALAEHRDRRRYPPPGRFVPVGERQLHVIERGAGSPTVVLDASLGAWSSHWSLLMAALSEHTRVVAYDRAGLGWSAAAQGPRTLRSLAADLDVVLEATVGSEPVVLVGHGIGALVTQLVAGGGRPGIAGWVAVDAFPPDFAGRMVLPEPVTGSLGEVLHLSGAARLSEWLRSGGEAGVISALSMQRRVRRATELERQLLIGHSDGEQLARCMDVPIRIISSPMPFGRRKPDEYALRWFAANQSLVDRSDDAMHFVVRDCDHWIPLHRPDAVLEPVRALLTSLRRPASR